MKIFQTIMFLFVFLNCSLSYGLEIPKLQTKNELNSPKSVVLTPNSATLYFENDIAVKDNKAEFIIPFDAENLGVFVKNNVVIGRSFEPCEISDESAYAVRVKNEIDQKSKLFARLEAINAELALWKSPAKDNGLNEFKWRLTEEPKAVENLVFEKMSIERELGVLGSPQKKIAPDLQEPIKKGKKIILELGKNADKVFVSYSYVLNNCNWQPFYSFTLKDDDEVEVVLHAQINQYSGTDWKNADIIVSMAGNGLVAPRKLPKWRLGLPVPRVQMKSKSLEMNMLDGVSLKAQGNAAVPVMESAAPQNVAETSDMFAYWKLAIKNLAQGESLVDLVNDEWKVKMYRLARPGLSGYSPVFIRADYIIDSSKAWPAGKAEYNVINGGKIQNVGNGYFDAAMRNVELNFGIDARVIVKTDEDKKERGEKGLISVDNIWKWKMIYTIENHHNMPVNVKVERPLAIVENEEIKVEYVNAPKASINDREKIIYWDLEVPANGKKEIMNETTVTLPQSDKNSGFNPVMPN